MIHREAEKGKAGPGGLAAPSQDRRDGIPRNCNFCGLCCTMVVRITESDIRRIESLGHRREDFSEQDVDGKTIFRRPQGWCYFFKREGNVGKCTIYEKRPAICRQYPGKPLCDLRDNVIFQFMDNKHPNVRLLWELSPKKSDKVPSRPPVFPGSASSG